MDIIKQKLNLIQKYLKAFVKWVLVAVLTGSVGGIIGSIFNISVIKATEFRQCNSILIYFLPFAGLLSALFYKILKQDNSTGTNEVIDSVRTDGNVSFAMAPAIFIGTVLTHMFGGSAGREGAALQLGGSIGSTIGKLIHLDEQDKHLITLCGMSGVFSALFGTPLTATFFSMEVISVGIIYYSSFFPCVVSSVIAYMISRMFNLNPVSYTLKLIPDLNILNISKVSIVAVLCAVVSIIFCKMLHNGSKLFSKYIKNNYLKIFIGGIIVVIITLICGSRDYNGAGMDIIQNAMNGNARPEAFVLKIILTVITISSGYKGGEIVPAFFIGSTLGCTVSSLIGFNPGFGAAIGLVALFCGVTNSLTASIILSIELFGSEGIIMFSIASAISYMLSGYCSLYSSQKIVYSKLKGVFINRNAS